MIKTIKLTAFLLLFTFTAIAQTGLFYYSANSTKKIMGVYVFIASEPITQYKYIATIDINGKQDDKDKAIADAIAIAKEKYGEIHGLIIKDFNFASGDIIKFPYIKSELQIGDKVSYSYKNEVRYGEVMKLNNEKLEALIRYNDISGIEKTFNCKYEKLSIVSNTKYNDEVLKFKEKYSIYNFKTGDLVYWNKESFFSDKSKLIKAKIIKLNANENKAIIEYVDDKNAIEQVTVSYLELSKI